MGPNSLFSSLNQTWRPLLSLVSSNPDSACPSQTLCSVDPVGKENDKWVVQCDSSCWIKLQLRLILHTFYWHEWACGWGRNVCWYISSMNHHIDKQKLGIQILWWHLKSYILWLCFYKSIFFIWFIFQKLVWVKLMESMCFAVVGVCLYVLSGIIREWWSTIELEW